MTNKHRVLTAILVAAAVLTTAATAARAPQRFTLSGSTIRGVDSAIRVTATGPISGSGTAIDKDSRNKDDLTLRLAGGTVAITSKDGATVAHPNLRTCTATIVVHGTFRITGGTGSFEGASGSGAYVRHDRILGARDAHGKCLGRGAPPRAVYDRLTMTGTASVG